MKETTNQIKAMLYQNMDKHDADDTWNLILRAFKEVAEAQRESDLDEIEDERGNKELATVIRAIKWNIRNTPLVTDKK